MKNAYQESLIHYSDMKNIIDTAVEDAVEFAHSQVAEKAILKGLTNDFIAEITSLTVQEVQEIRLKINKK